MLKFALSLTAAVLSFNQHSFAETTIYGGREVTVTDAAAKFMVAVEHTEGKYCSGMLVAQNLVLTATHCFKITGSTSAKIVFGFDARQPIQTRKVTEMQFHEGYVQYWPQPSDLALLKFEGELPAGYEPIEINYNESLSKSLTTATISGYGKQKAASGTVEVQFYGLLKQVDLQVERTADRDVFSRPYEGITSFNQNESTGGACNGDSGGAAFTILDGKPILVGVNNAGSRSNCTGYLRVCDTSYAKNAEWLKSKIAEMSAR